MGFFKSDFKQSHIYIYIKKKSIPIDSGHFRNRFRRLLTYISYDPSKAISNKKTPVHPIPMDSGHFRNRFRRLLTYISYDPSKGVSSNPRKTKKTQFQWTLDTFAIDSAIPMDSGHF